MGKRRGAGHAGLGGVEVGVGLKGFVDEAAEDAILEADDPLIVDAGGTVACRRPVAGDFEVEFGEAR